MNAKVLEMEDEIDRTVSAIQDLDNLMLAEANGVAGAQCLYMLVGILEGLIGCLWRELRKE